MTNCDGIPAAADAIVVDLGARAARSRGAHLPEVVRRVEGEDAVGGEVVQPYVPRLVIGRRYVIAPKVGGVQPLRVETKLLREALPRHGDRFHFEVIAEGPVAQHLEEGVVVDVLPDIVQIVMLPAGADAFLGVGGAGQGGHGVVGGHGPEEERFVLVHARVGEEEGRVVVRDYRGGGPGGVGMLGGEEVEEG